MRYRNGIDHLVRTGRRVYRHAQREMPVLAWGRWVVLLGAVLLLAGCSAPSPASPPVPIPARAVSAPPPDEETTPPRSDPTGSALVTIDPIGFGLRPGAGSHRLVAWATQYCEAAGLSPCSDIADRAERLCIERWDCHPALLVPFREGTAAFLSGGRFTSPVVYAVWLSENPMVAVAGGSRHLLESYLLTVGVCPDQGGGYPRGPECPA